MNSSAPFRSAERELFRSRCECCKRPPAHRASWLAARSRVPPEIPRYHVQRHHLQCPVNLDFVENALLWRPHLGFVALSARQSPTSCLMWRSSAPGAG
jgi:hypothetical protein